MAHLKAKELRGLTEDELKEKVDALKKGLFSLRLQAKLGKLEKHSTVRITKRDVARIRTVMKEKETSR